MRRLFYLILCISLIACDDGDLQIETIDFDSVTIQTCDIVTPTSNNLLFKLNSTEALILELPFGAINNAVTDGALEYDLASTNTARVTYRSFSDTVSSDYFCSTIPITSPTVIDEVTAEGGSIFITTVLSEDSLSYEHTIELSGISFVTSENERITDLSINNFGTVVTIIPPEEEG